MNRFELLSMLYERSPLYISFEHFSDSLAGWELDPIFFDGGLAGIFVLRGPEFHFCKTNSAYQAGRGILAKYPGSLIAKHGFATTRTPIEDTRQQRFNLRLGFYEVARDEFDIHYRIDQMRSKEKLCQ